MLRRIALFIIVFVAFSLAGCIGQLQVTSPVPRTTIRTGADSYIVIAPKSARIEWATMWPFSFPYNNRGGR